MQISFMRVFCFKVFHFIHKIPINIPTNQILINKSRHSLSFYLVKDNKARIGLWQITTQHATASLHSHNNWLAPAGAPSSVKPLPVLLYIKKNNTYRNPKITCTWVFNRRVRQSDFFKHFFMVLIFALSKHCTYTA